MKPSLGTEKQDIEALRRRHEELNTRRIQAATNLDSVRKQIEQLKKEAKARYGTDDLDELRRKLDEMKTENERKRAEYQQHLDAIEARLADVERQFAAESVREPRD